ncbi:S41 family peptidase [Massilia sp. CF038]|uniref:S41 family peptidase n=1 Tax=Massilia sp. CF038 TaxID=1881045 RepID=UPI000916C309|nr:S41 family peptidase [Massilia sp. CF038]SHH45141.1 N-terminal domain of Peptidase_S41 [Massilia sp. CF038]
MSGKKEFFAGVVLGAMLSLPVFATPETPLSASARAAVLQTLATELITNYIDPAVAKRVGNAIAKKNAQGGYASAASAQAFSAALAKDLRDLSGDLHFNVKFDERLLKPSSEAAAPRPNDMDDARTQAIRAGYGIEKIERLPGNVAYIELSKFGPADVVGPAYTSAISLMAGADALILDLRRNGGGSPSSVAYLMSHFFPAGDKRHLNDLYDRPSNTTREYWTLTTVTERYRKPVYVLTSARTGSAAEECAYNFQTQKRGTVVGETTLGAANPVSPYRLGHGIVAAIPDGRSINPITKTSWERVGVKPNIAVPAAQALQSAHVAILRDLVTSATDEGERIKLQGMLAMAEKGESETPVYISNAKR